MRSLITIIVVLFFISSYGQLFFQDVSVAQGVNGTYGESVLGGGLSFCDFDGDGWDDLTFSSDETQEVLFFKNTNGTFSLIDLGINVSSEAKQVIWADYDNDGDKDFFYAGYSGGNKLFENTGSLNFVDNTAAIPGFDSFLYTYGISFGDIDNDGDLDLFISNRDGIAFTERNYLYRNDNGIFVDITSAAGINLESSLAFCSAFFDFDNDGDQDLYVANDKDFKNRLYKNEGSGFFTDVSDSSGAGIIIDAMSTTIGDYNNDGWFDIYVTNTIVEGNHFLKNNGDGTFTNVTSDTGTAFNSFAWGSVFLDADLDTDLDLYVSGMLTTSNPLPSAFYENQGDNTYLIPSGIGFANDNRESYANAIGDFNNDGLPDIAVVNDTDNHFLWENTTTNSNNWLKVKLEGVTSNKDGIGSKIEVFANGVSQYRYTLCGEGYISQNSNTEFIGLGNATNIDYVSVLWPSGTQDVFTNVAPNQLLSIQEGESLSIDEYDAISLEVYPNPTKNRLNLQFGNIFTSDEIKVVLYSLLGEKVYSQNIVSLNSTVDVSNFTSGIYFLKCKVGEQLISKKVVLE